MQTAGPIALIAGALAVIGLIFSQAITKGCPEPGAGRLTIGSVVMLRGCP